MKRKNLAQKLAKLLAAVRSYAETGNRLVELGYGEAVREKAAQAVDELIRLNRIPASARERSIEHLVFNKQAALNAIIRMAREAEVSPLGSVTEKYAGEADLPESERRWRYNWGF